jgi:hypothetical protein
MVAMNPKKILEYVDHKVITLLESDHSFKQIIIHLDELFDKFSKRDSFIECSEEYLIENWHQISFRNRYTTYYAFSCLKRINDIDWILSKNLEINDVNKYKLLFLKDKFDAKY